MKEKVKAFLKENKEIIIAGSCMVIGGVAIIAVLASGQKRIADQFTTFNKDGIIKFLQEMNPNTKLAIFKETLEDAYQIVMI